MARGYRQARPGLHVDADMVEGAHAVGVLRGVVDSIRTEAHQNAVVEATHAYFAQAFDHEYMKGVAGTAKEHFHHVYEYSADGDPYRNIGDPMSKLWIHHLQKPVGGSAIASWKWKPATQPVPSYEQRRRSAVGHDDIRNFSDKDFEELLQKSNGRRHVYVWKSVMLEYGIVANIVPQDPKRWLMVPMFGGKKRFVKQHLQGQQAPGDTLGRFTAAWVGYWGGIVPAEFQQRVGEEIERDAQARVNAALNAGKAKPRRERRQFNMGVFNNFEEAFRAGREQGEAAIRSNQISMRRIAQNTGWSNPLGYADD